MQKSCHIEMPRCLMLMGCLQKMLGNAAVDQAAVVLSGLGVFTSHKHPEYVQEDPQTGAMTLYPPRITYHFQSEPSAEGTPCAELLAEYAHVELEEASSFVNGVVKAINQHLNAGEEIEVPGIGAFKNVLTHQSDLKHVDFMPCDQMKDLVNAPFACFEPYVISAGGAEVSAPEIVENPEPVAEEVEEVAEEDVAEPEEDVAEPEIAEESVIEETPAPVVEEAPAPVTKEEEPVPAPNISFHKDGHIIIKQEDKKSEERSTKRVLYISLALIMAGCGFLLWLMFGDKLSNNDNPPTEAKVIETAAPKPAPLGFAPVEEPVAEAIEEKAPVEEPVKKVEEEPVAPKQKVEKEASAKAEPIKPVKEEPAKTEPAKPVKEEPVKATVKEFHRMKDADGKEVTVKLASGSRLTLIALEHFGDKSFWPYIFEVNKDKLKAPNLVQTGMVLYLPDPAYYGIDAQDPASVQKAKNKAAQLLK